MKTVLILLAEIAGLLIVFAIFIFALNYFNILSLSTMYPKQFGFLYHKKTLSEKAASGAISANAPLAATPTPVVNNLQNQYLAYAQQNLQKPTLDITTNTYSVTGIYYSALTDTIKVITTIGAINFEIDKNRTIFQTTAPVSLPPKVKSATIGDFINSIRQGSIIQVIYTYGTPNPQAIKMIATKDLAK
ncbi:MAG: hypothetical protein ABSE17_04435 [Candidatus Levyibacteriota bacterium]|jgi:hypothetical protein